MGETSPSFAGVAPIPNSANALAHKPKISPVIANAIGFIFDLLQKSVYFSPHHAERRNILPKPNLIQ
jgi:hypothetical protein